MQTLWKGWDTVGKSKGVSVLKMNNPIGLLYFGIVSFGLGVVVGFVSKVLSRALGLKQVSWPPPKNKKKMEVI